MIEAQAKEAFVDGFNIDNGVVSSFSVLEDYNDDFGVLIQKRIQYFGTFFIWGLIYKQNSGLIIDVEAGQRK